MIYNFTLGYGESEPIGVMNAQNTWGQSPLRFTSITSWENPSTRSTGTVIGTSVWFVEIATPKQKATTQKPLNSSSGMTYY
jgi:hypothetical protein